MLTLIHTSGPRSQPHHPNISSKFPVKYARLQHLGWHGLITLHTIDMWYGKKEFKMHYDKSCLQTICCDGRRRLQAT